MPQNVSRSSKKSVSPMSAIRELLNEGKSNPVKKLVDYPYSETDESEDDRSRSSVACGMMGPMNLGDPSTTTPLSFCSTLSVSDWCLFLFLFTVFITILPGDIFQ
jgi:hypothetical protein